ncbi:unnamed protein product [Gongylonema pulchrum]|uniref:Neur_chan_memb domain-containing protein n=1 Tax=Gongylonema pulchrum TaxID=637853 RepID=A0A183EMJ5_9BILA|nr:unnamed protein product [Gongylonema pulchrum]
MALPLNYHPRIDPTQWPSHLRKRRDSDESRDSGVSSLNTPIELDGILWCFTFFLTVWHFKLPFSLFISPNVDCMRAFETDGSTALTQEFEVASNPQQKNTVMGRCLDGSRTCGIQLLRFCVATWNLWKFWTIYIVFVTSMFTIIAVSLA